MIGIPTNDACLEGCLTLPAARSYIVGLSASCLLRLGIPLVVMRAAVDLEVSDATDDERALLVLLLRGRFLPTFDASVMKDGAAVTFESYCN